jgi:protein tyrosine/serine phosphatase
MATSTPTIPAPGASAPIQAPPPPRRRWRRLATLAGLLLIGLLLAEPLRVLLGNNVHTVIEGQVYRSGQPSGPWLTSFARGHGIRTVINLRGTCYPQGWYLEEAHAAQELGISLEDICLSAGRLPSPHELRQLVLALKHAERPLLLHCRHGADRTGLAAAVALLLDQDIALEEARRQLSIRFGHLAVGRATILNRVFEFYTDWLQREGRQHSRADFEHWLLEEYRGGHCQYEMEEVVKVSGPPRVGLPLAYRVRVRNTSAYPWRFKPGSTAGIHLGYFVWPTDLDDSVNDERVEVSRAALLDAVVAPGETFTALVVVKPFIKPGRYRLRIDMLEEGHCWFYQTGAEPYAEEFDVRE